MDFKRKSSGAEANFRKVFPSLKTLQGLLKNESAKLRPFIDNTKFLIYFMLKLSIFIYIFCNSNTIAGIF